jgi:hypothetical protein
MEDMRSDAVTSTGRVSSAVYSAKTSTTAVVGRVSADAADVSVAELAIVE